MTILIWLMLAAQNPVDEPPVHDGGVCAGISWIALAPGEKVSRERGPDFDVLRFNGAGGANDHWWGVYSGWAAQVRGNGATLLTRHGVTVRRSEENGQLRGYLAQKGNAQNHFFGSAFAGSSVDKAFFDRVDFGPKGQALCAKDL
jgi:hypothetical protein